MEANLIMQMKNKVRKVIPVPNEVTVIGRRKNCDLRIPLESISRRHCEIHCASKGVVLRDLGSRNGTLLNGTKIDESEQILQPGDKIQIGPITFVVQVDGHPSPEAVESPPIQADDSFPAIQAEKSKNKELLSDEGLDDSGLDDILDLDDEFDLDEIDLDEI